MLCIQTSQASSATWKRNHRSGDWNTKTNWKPATVPNGSADTATFALSNTTAISISANTELNGITFTAAATNPYTITANPTFTLTLSGAGIVNNSGTTQNVVTAVDASVRAGTIVFSNGATGGSNVSIFNGNGTINFLNTSTAGGATINDLNFLNDFDPTTNFFNRSTAGNSTIFTDTSSVLFATTRLQAARSSTSIAILFYDSPTIPLQPIRTSGSSITPMRNSWTTPLQAARRSASAIIPT